MNDFIASYPNHEQARRNEEIKQRCNRAEAEAIHQAGAMHQEECIEALRLKGMMLIDFGTHKRLTRHM